jgi:hypothetical protein
VVEGSYAFETGRPWAVEVVDSQGRVLEREDLALGEFGTLHHTFALAEFAPTSPTDSASKSCGRTCSCYVASYYAE